MFAAERGTLRRRVDLPTEVARPAILPALATFLAAYPELDSGALVEVLADFRPPPLAVSLVVAHRQNLSRRVRAFMQRLETLLTPYLA